LYADNDPCPSSLEPLINFNNATPGLMDSINIPVKEDEPIGEIMASNKNPELVIIGSGPSIENFNLATAAEKVILLTK
jgi:hypothetical protein